MSSGHETSKKPAVEVDAPAKVAGRAGKTASRSDDTQDRDMGSALRSVYQRAVEEDVPDDLLDLLGKLD